MYKISKLITRWKLTKSQKGLFTSLGGASYIWPSYLGPVATNLRHPNQTAATNQVLMCRSHHVACDDITALQIVLPNWYVPDTVAALETSPGGTSNWRASIEYPLGTIAAQITFGGQVTGISTTISNLISDAIAVSIPRGADFYVRTWCYNATGLVYSDSVDNLHSEILQFATAADITAASAYDFTMGGTITLSGTYSLQPVAILAQTRRGTAVLFGDSKCRGAYDYTGDNTSSRGEISRSLGQNKIAYMNFGVGGSISTDILTGSAMRQALAAYAKYVVWQSDFNDLFNKAYSSGAVQNKLSRCFALLPNLSPVVSTTTPGTDAGNTATLNAGDEANREAVNTWKRSGCPLSRTNFLRNSTAQGAIVGMPGTLPTNYIGQTASSCVANVVATGPDDGFGRPYFDLRWVGTPTAGGFQLQFESHTQIAALVGQEWAASCNISLVAGSRTNITLAFGFQEYDSGGVFKVSHSSNLPNFNSLGASPVLFETAAVTSNASCAFVTAFVSGSVTAGNPVDITLRFAGIQLERYAASPFIPTINAAVTVTKPANTPCVDVTSAVESQVTPGLWANSVWTADGVHENATGYAQIPPSGVIPASYFR